MRFNFSLNNQLGGIGLTKILPQCCYLFRAFKLNPSSLCGKWFLFSYFCIMTNDEILARIAQCDGFIWDAGNIYKAWMSHRVLPDECHEAFENRARLTATDMKHSGEEERFFLYGQTAKGPLLSIVFTIRGNKIRVISPRDMSKRERTSYYAAFERNS